MPKQSILIVEDEEDIQELLRYIITREGYPVSAVESGEPELHPLVEELGIVHVV
jgi:CheY-like chemotaxis protein